MDNFWNAIDNLRRQLIREERTEQLQLLCQKEVSESDKLKITSRDTMPTQPGGASQEQVSDNVNDNDNVANGQTTNKTSEEVMTLIETTLLRVLQAVAEGRPPSLSYRNRNTWNNIRFQEGKGLEMTSDPSEIHLRFDCISTVKRFALTVKLLVTIHRLLQTNTYCTKRDLFYQDPQKFGSQSCVDALVDNIGCMLRVPRACLHVLATSKGLICGDLKYTDVDGSRVDCRDTSSMVPAHVEAIQSFESDAHFVLVVEKDATYQRLVDEQVTTKLGPCIITTAKGFPDVNTRLLLRRLWETLHIPIFALVDADPHGMEILMVYKFGSRSLSFNSSSMTVPVVRWLGVWPSDITRLNIPRAALIPLTYSDIRKAHELLRRPYMHSLPTWKAELETMLASGVKAEIQCLDSISSHFMSDVYLPNKLCYGGWI